MTLQSQKNLLTIQLMFNTLVDRISEYESVVLGFSGGVDSSLVACALKAARIPYVCATVQTPLQSKRELAQSAFFCEEYDLCHKVIELDVLEVDKVRENSKDRCYYCKREIFSRLCKLSEELGYKTVIDGSNADDLKEYRPGLKAKDELGVRSPLAELGITKAQIRQISKEQGLPTWDTPSNPCLATRVPYNEPIRQHVLISVEKAEDILHKVGAGNIRVRAHGDIARIEADDVDMVYKLLDESTRKAIKECGFKFVTLDLDGYKRGSFD